MFERIQQLSAAMAAGDSLAVEAFYLHYFDWMYWQARRATRRDEAFCLDVVQDAVLRVIRTVKPVESEPRFRGWLRLVVQTTAFDLLRSEKRRKNREAMAGTSPVSIDSDSIQLDWLAEQISALDPELVKIIELRFEQNWSLRKIGQGMGLTVGAVDGRLRRALKDIRLKAEETPLPTEPLVSSSIDAPAIIKKAASDAVVVPILPAVSAPPATVPSLFAMPAIEFEAIKNEPIAEIVEISVVVDDPDLSGLDDEAGAYDDKL